MSGERRCYYVGQEQFERAGPALDRAREIARELARTAGCGRNVPVVRSDGEKTVIRGFLDSRGRATTITLPRKGRRW